MNNFPPDVPPPPDPDDREGEPAYSEADWQGLVDYLCGEGSAGLRTVVEQRLANDAAFAEFAAPLILAWQSPIPQPAWDWEDNWTVIQHKATALNGSPSSTTTSTKQRSTPPSTLSQRRHVPAWVRNLIRSPARWRPIQWATLTCAVIAMLVTKDIVHAILWPRYHYQGGLTGATVQLPDSSIVILAPGSYLGTEHGFPKITRTVYLFGDARFTVVHNQRIPFIVQVPGVSARVLGTTFRMQVDTIPHVRVDVTRGAVAIEMCDTSGHWHQLNILTAGEAVHVPMLAVWMAQAGHTLAATGMSIREAAYIQGALRRAAVRAGAAAATRQGQKDSTKM